MGKTTILGVDFDTYTLDEAAEHAVNLMNESGQHIVCTPNPEIVMEAQHDRELMGILKAADMVTPDGVGVVWASKYSKTKITERVSGYDLVLHIFEKIKNSEHAPLQGLEDAELLDLTRNIQYIFSAVHRESLKKLLK